MNRLPALLTVLVLLGCTPDAVEPPQVPPTPPPVVINTPPSIPPVPPSPTPQVVIDWTVDGLELTGTVKNAGQLVGTVPLFVEPTFKGGTTVEASTLSDGSFAVSMPAKTVPGSYRVCVYLGQFQHCSQPQSLPIH